MFHVEQIPQDFDAELAEILGPVMQRSTVETVRQPNGGRGRPTLRTPEIRAAILETLRETGMRRERAAELHGVSASALLTWCEDDRQLRMELGAARARWLQARAKQLQETDDKGLLAHPKEVLSLIRAHMGEEYAEKAVVEHSGEIGHLIITPAAMAAVQARHRAALGDSSEKTVDVAPAAG